MRSTWWFRSANETPEKCRHCKRPNFYLRCAAGDFTGCTNPRCPAYVGREHAPMSRRQIAAALKRLPESAKR